VCSLSRAVGVDAMMAVISWRKQPGGPIGDPP